MKPRVSFIIFSSLLIFLSASATASEYDAMTSKEARRAMDRQMAQVRDMFGSALYEPQKSESKLEKEAELRRKKEAELAQQFAGWSEGLNAMPAPPKFKETVGLPSFEEPPTEKPAESLRDTEWKPFEEE